jgi:predicted amidohydrolase YtcJ
MSGLLLRHAELGGRGRADVRVTAGRVAEIGHRLTAGTADRVVDCRGGALLPGLCDHHLHLAALSAWDGSVVCGPPAVADRAGLAAVLAGASGDPGGWIRGVGYVESVAGDLDAAELDRLVPHRPVRIQHRSGALWTLNSLALELIGAAAATHPGVERDRAGRLTGRLWRADDWLRSRLPRARPPGTEDLARIGKRLASFGITAVTDATPDLDASALAALRKAAACGALPQRLHLLGVPLGSEGVAEPPRLTTGPYKIVVADSGLPGLAELTARIRTAHEAGRAVAVHCVTREALLLVLAALAEAGGQPGDRIEHASLVPAEMIPTLARQGVRVVTQPGFLSARGDDYRRDVPPSEHRDLYRGASLLAGGVPVALSSDAPYGPLDPWRVMAAAVRRQTATGEVLGGGEKLTPEQALYGYLAAPGDPGGRPRTVTAGATADLVLLSTPLCEALRRLDARLVRATVLNGELLDH